MTRTLVTTLLLALQAGRPGAEERLSRHRNLGKAFFENPTTQAQAVAEFRKALELAPESARDRLNLGIALLTAGQTAEGIAEVEKVQQQDPALPHTWFHLAVQFKKAGEYEKAQRQFEGFARLAPAEPTGPYNLGVLHKLAGRNDDAIRAFETASRLDPNLAAPHFQLYNLYRQAGRREEAAQRLRAFQKAKDAQANAVSSEDMEWSWYAEVLDPVDLKAAAAEDPPRDWKFLARRLAAAPAAGTMIPRPAVFDADGDGRPDLLVNLGGELRLYPAGLAPGAVIARGVVTAAPGDFNNDGLADVGVVDAQGPGLLVNAKGRFSRQALAAAPAGKYSLAAWLDYDHDNDLDLLLLGESNALLRNEGTSGFADRSGDFPFVAAAGRALSAVPFRLVPDSKSFDLLVSYENHGGVLYRDRLAGKFEARPMAIVPAGAVATAVDADHNGFFDLAVEAGGKTRVYFNTSRPEPGADMSWKAEGELASPAVFGDFENRGAHDVLAAGAQVRYLPVQHYGPAKPVAGVPVAARAYAAADFNADGKMDVAVVGADGSVQVLVNQTVTPYQAVRIALGGIKNPKLAVGSEIEVKIGPRYQKKLYQGFPMAFGVRDARSIDAVRITWPNGLIQSEATQAAAGPVRPLRFPEAQRLSGSCPQVWTWNGREFVYVTDVLGVAPLGAMSGDGSFFPVDHLEHIQLPASMQPREGAYEVRLTEELSEVAYIDQVKLMAVDHPASESIYLNEKFQAPPYPDLKIYTAGPGVLRARTSGGDLDFGGEAAALRRPILVLSGWVDWADGSQFRNASQQKGGELRMPSLEAPGADGQWYTVLEDMGMPAGKPKTIAVELRREWLATGRLRIRTNLALHWTDAFVAEGGENAATAAAAAPTAAELRFRGFSLARIHPERKEPEMFFYGDPAPASLWNPTPGLYTRFGDVRPLMEAADDRFAIMGSGDELVLRFDTAAFPPVKPGLRRSWVLAVDGWAKDRDPNTAHSQTVEPLPFHGMSRYPYAAGEAFPDDDAHRRWRREYNTRPALRLIRPLH